MTEIPPTQEQPAPHRRWERSTTDRMIGGVAGGVGRRLDIDPLAVRITFVILAFAGGLGVLAYLAGLAFMPSDDPEAPPLRWGLARTIGAGLLGVAALAILLPGWAWGPAMPLLAIAGLVLYLLVRVIRDDGGTHLGRVAARTGIAIVLLALAIGGIVAAAAGAATGGGVVVAGLIMACGVGLVGGAFRGGARWLIAPALVLALPLAAVAAVDLDVRGTWGERTYSPATAQELEQGYDMGLGELRVDTRGVDLPPGRTVLPVELGMGEIVVIVDPGTCVTSDADIELGVLDRGRGGEEGGIDLQLEDSLPVAAGVPELHVDAQVDVGAVRIGDEASDFRGGGPPWENSGPAELFDDESLREACR